ncbi:hypothetical protein PMAYCL1PPCAC_21645, partial [Pristionchus mayeri]
SALSAMLGMIRFLLFAALIYAVHSKCPTGFDSLRDGECHKEIHEAVKENPQNAVSNTKIECKAYGAGAVIIRNQQDQDYWVSLAQESRKKGIDYGNILLGLECSKLKAQWQWGDGSAITFKPAANALGIAQQCDNSDDPWAYRCMWTVDPGTGNWNQQLSFNKGTREQLFHLQFASITAWTSIASCRRSSGEGRDH